MTFGVLIDTFVTEKGKIVKIYEYLRFIDSFKMMNSSLEKLVEICLSVLKSKASGETESKVKGKQKRQDSKGKD